MAEVVLLASIGQGTADSDAVLGSLSFSPSGAVAARRGRALVLLLLVALDRRVGDRDELLRRCCLSAGEQSLGDDKAEDIAAGYGGFDDGDHDIGDAEPYPSAAATLEGDGALDAPLDEFTILDMAKSAATHGADGALDGPLNELLVLAPAPAPSAAKHGGDGALDAPLNEFFILAPAPSAAKLGEAGALDTHLLTAHAAAGLGDGSLDADPDSSAAAGLGDGSLDPDPDSSAAASLDADPDSSAATGPGDAEFGGLQLLRMMDLADEFLSSMEAGADDMRQRSLVVLFSRSTSLQAVGSFDGLHILCDEARREQHGMSLPWISRPAMTAPCLLLMLPQQLSGGRTGCILIPWHLGCLFCRVITPAPSSSVPTDLQTSQTGLMDLKIDVLMRIDSNLLPEDALKLRLTCNELLTSLPTLLDCNLSPLLLISNISEKIPLGLYSPVLGQTVLLTGIGSSIDLKNAHLLSSHQQWVLLKCNGDLLILNLLTNVSREIPPPPKHGQHYSVLTLRVETNANIHILGVTTPDEYSTFIGEYFNNDWVEHSFQSDPPFLISNVSNPVCLGQRYYCLGVDGTIGVYLNGIWETFRMPDATAYDLSFGHLTVVEGHMVVLLLGSRRSVIVVLDADHRRWIAAPRLHGVSLFSGTRQTVPWVVDQESFHSKIILPMFLMKPPTVTGYLMKRQDRWFVRSTESRGTAKLANENTIWVGTCSAVNQTQVVFPYRFGPGNSLWITLSPDTRVLHV